jgi:thiamine monophosphate synthase
VGSVTRADAANAFARVSLGRGPIARRLLKPRHPHHAPHGMTALMDVLGIVALPILVLGGIALAAWHRRRRD